jgi:hypothetical protein
MVRDLRGTIERQGAEMGVLLTLTPPTRGMIDEANRSGSYTWPVNGASFPRLQILTAEQLLAGELPKMPPALTPYLRAPRHAPEADQLKLGG